MDGRATGRGRGRGRGGRAPRVRKEKPKKEEMTPAEVGAAYTEAPLFDVDRKSHSTVIIAQFRKEDLPDKLHDQFDKLENIINESTLQSRSRQGGYQTQWNLGFEPGVIELGFLNRTPSASDRPPRIPMMKSVASFSSVEGKHAYLKLAFSAPEAIPSGEENLRVHTLKNGDLDPFSRMHNIAVCIGQDSLDLEATSVTTVTDKDDSRIPKLMKLHQDFATQVQENYVKRVSVKFVGLHNNGMGEEHRSVWSSGLFTESYTPYNLACEAEFKLLQLFFSQKTVNLSLWCFGSDEMPTWLDNLKTEIDRQYREGSPFLAYWINKNPLKDGNDFQWGQQYLDFEDQPSPSIGAYTVFPDVLAYCTVMGLGTVSEYNAVKGASDELSTLMMDARFVEAEGFVKGAGYYVFTSAVDDNLISALPQGVFAKMDFGGEHATYQRFPVTVFKPKFLAFTQKCFLAHRSYQGNERTDEGFDQFSNIAVTAMPLAEFKAITSVDELTEKLKLLPPKKVSLHFDDCMKVPKRAANALSSVLSNEDGVHTHLIRSLIGQDLRPAHSYNIFRCMERQPIEADLPSNFTKNQLAFGEYLKNVPFNHGIGHGGAGCAKTHTLFNYCGILWTNSRSNTVNEIQPDRKFHQVLYTSDANSTCEKAIEVLEGMIQSNPMKYGNILAIRAYALKTEENILSSKDKDRKFVDENRQTRPTRYLNVPTRPNTSPAVTTDTPANPADPPPPAVNSSSANLANPPLPAVDGPRSPESLDAAGTPGTPVAEVDGSRSASTEAPTPVAALDDSRPSSPDAVIPPADDRATGVEAVAVPTAPAAAVTEPVAENGGESLSDIMLELHQALEEIKRDKKVAGVNDHRLLHPEYSLAYRVLEIMRIIPMTPAMAAKNPSTFPTAVYLWRKQFQQILEPEDRKELKSQIQDIRVYAMSLADLILTPLNNLADHKLFGEVKPDLGIVDEATLSSETTHLIAFAKMPLAQDGVLPATTWISLADTKQSNNVVISTYLNNHFDAQNQVPLVTRMVAMKYPVFEFTDLFRSCSGSMDFVNFKYYQGKLKYHESTVNRPDARNFVAKIAGFIATDPSFGTEAAARATEFTESNRAVAVLNVKGTSESKEGSSRFNEMLIGPHMEMIKVLTELTPGRTPSIACLAPYNSHVGKLESAYAVLKAVKPKLNFDVEFGSIDGFQGRDKEFVILAYPNVNSAGFTANDGRFVSSVTRHKNGLILIADCGAVGQMEKRERNPFLSFIEHIRNHKGIFELADVGDYSPSSRLTLDEVPQEEQVDSFVPGTNDNWDGFGGNSNELTEQVDSFVPGTNDNWDGFGGNSNELPEQADNEFAGNHFPQGGVTFNAFGESVSTIEGSQDIPGQQEGFVEEHNRDEFDGTLGAGLSNLRAKVDEELELSGTSLPVDISDKSDTIKQAALETLTSIKSEAVTVSLPKASQTNTDENSSADSGSSTVNITKESTGVDEEFDPELGMEPSEDTFSDDASDSGAALRYEFA